MKATKLALQNRIGQVIRVIDWDQPEILLVYRGDTHRVEIVHNTDLFEKDEVPFEILFRGKTDNVSEKAVSIPGIGKLVSMSASSTLSPTVEWKEDKNIDEKKIAQWIAGIYMAIIALIIFSAWLFKPKAEETNVVTINPQDRVEQEIKESKKQVNVSERKIIKQKVIARVSNKTVKTRNDVRTNKTSSNKRVALQRSIEVNKLGALGAFGGVSTGIRGSKGLNLNSGGATRGTSLNANGANGAGGFESSIQGKGLVAAPIGQGGLGAGAGGYGTRGKGGGRSGYGQMKIAGETGGYTLPLEEEALIEGGLDKDQIAAVINRHLGQIIYCYEKGLQQDADLAGRVAVNFVIGGRGSVSTARVSHSSLKSAQVESCIIGKLKSWQFPKPYGNVDVKVSYPFVLKRVGQG